MKKPRKNLSKKLRFEIFKRDDFTCQYCGKTPINTVLEIDHILPVKEGGGNDESNLITACFDCNRGKGANLLQDKKTPLKEKAKYIKEKEEQLLKYQSVMQAVKDRLDSETWKIIDELGIENSDGSIQKRHFSAIKTKVELLGYFEALDSAEIASTKGIYNRTDRLKYFFGVCNCKIRNNGAE